ncbi:hypothetical protein BDZ97DRAFT_2071512 [Flammula alnicola]|nr:hypothetical protein BDZ97DRAFT_2071512 [Flammula alnicola]
MSASIQSLPDVAIRRILEYSVSEPLVLPPPPSEPRRALSHICANWRRVLVSTPSYWNRIKFSYGPFNDTSKLLQLWEVCRRRSGSTLLYLDFVGDPVALFGLGTRPTRREDMIFGRCRISIMRSIILPNITRIRALRCLICAQEDMDAFLDMRGGAFDSVEFLDIAFSDEFAVRLTSFLLNQRLAMNTTPFQSFPRIRHCYLRCLNIPIEIHPIDLNLPWSQLISLNLGAIGIPPNVFTMIMRRTSHTLVEGIFRIMFERKPHALLLPRLGAVDMPYLQALQLNLHDASLDQRLFRVLRLPVLHTLIVNFSDQYEEHFNIMAACINISVYSTQTLQMLKIIELPPPFPSPYPPFKQRYDGRRMRARSCHPLEAYFLALRNLRVLHLPCGIYLCVTTVEKIAKGEILPLLQELDLGSIDIQHTFSMIQRRNDLAHHHSLVPGTSSGKHGLIGPCVFLRSVRIVLPVCNLHEQQTIVEKANSLISTGIYIAIYLLESSKFYVA